MRFLQIVCVGFTSLAFTVPAYGQKPQPQVSVEQIVCQYSNECNVDADAVPPVENMRGFSLGVKQPQGKPSAKSQPATRTRPAARAVRASRSPRVSRNDLLVSFEHNSTRLTEQAKANISIFAKALNSPQLLEKRFEISGHTNRVGSKQHNLNLSAQRAEAVAQFLVEQGVSRARIRTKGLGFGQLLPAIAPAAPQHRRVEADLIRVD